MELDLILRNLLFLAPTNPDYLDKCLQIGLEPTPTGYAIGIFNDTTGGQYAGASEDVDFLRMVEEFAEKGEIQGAEVDPTKFTKIWPGWPAEL